MNKKLIIALAAVVVIAAGGFFAYTQMNKDDADTSNASTTNKTATDAKDSGVIPSGKNTLRNLLGLNNSIMCTYSDQESSGTVYIAGENRMRYNYTSTNPEHGDGSMIVVNDTVYVWQKDATEGMKMTQQSTFDNDDSTASDEVDDEGVDVNEEMDFKCDKWSVNNDVFTPPSNVNFMSLADAFAAPQQ